MSFPRLALAKCYQIISPLSERRRLLQFGDAKAARCFTVVDFIQLSTRDPGPDILFNTRHSRNAFTVFRHSCETNQWDKQTENCVVEDVSKKEGQPLQVFANTVQSRLKTTNSPLQGSDSHCRSNIDRCPIIRLRHRGNSSSMLFSFE